MEYPEEIYYVGAEDVPMSDSLRKGWTGWGRRLAFRVGYKAGKAEQPDPLEGYSNLTAAISAGEPIDWEELDGLKTQCVKPGVGTLRGTLERNESRPADNPAGWWRKGADSLYVSAFIYGWTEHYGWTLWIEGEVPMRRKTADQLEVGTYFLGERWSDAPRLMYVGRPSESIPANTIYEAPGMFETITPPSEWRVLEEYGTFQKPEGK